MANDGQKTLKELQMAELRESFGIKEDADTKKSVNPMHRSANSAKIAKLYEDAAEYEEELACFQGELAVIQANSLQDVATVLTEDFPREEGSYADELKAVVGAGWTQEESLALVKETAFQDVVATLNTSYPEHEGDFEAEVRDTLVKRWEMLIEIKKEHVKEELAEMKLRGMKPDHIRKVYQNYHGIEN
ncbi:MAG: hypothetical protein Q9M36_06995 [Sulfurovum sp.]|nr:hypothetical protein [Sulfurovum sp.]